MTVDRETLKRRRQAAVDMVDALNNGRREWRMSIPVQDSDPDVVIMDALVDSKSLLAELEETEAAVRETQEAMHRANIRWGAAVVERDQLKAENERLREALTRIAGQPLPEERYARDRVIHIRDAAHRALGEEAS